ncbi:MAG: ribulose-phosphate 3-epimerase [Actinomycetota bacterium]|nr:ribulose-phosphate 3-epimerase [Actinomycetota bacterium]
MTREAKLAPSILSADFARLGDQVAMVEPFADRLHIDVMDGHFVPNLTMGPVIVESLRPATDLQLEVHLMVQDPGGFVDAFIDAGADRLIFHAEVVSDPAGLARRITDNGAKAGVAVNPDTPWRTADGCLGDIDLFLCMTVHPGFGGQPFMEDVLSKVQQVHEAVTERNLDVDIQVDGGVGPRTAPLARSAGANVFVAGHAIFRAENPVQAMKDIWQAIGGQELA